MTKIEWTNKTLNVMTGCTPISEGCKNCYAKTMSKRLKGMGQLKYRNEFKPTFHPGEFSKIESWRKPRKIFLNSMSDTFHEHFTDDEILNTFDQMMLNETHTFQVLTKRTKRLLSLSHRIAWMPNIWMGVSVELKKYYHRIHRLMSTGAKVRFLSLEPLLGPMPDLPLYGIDWVIVGGESGPKSKVRKMELQWARDIRDQCIGQNVKFFYKQGGTLNPCGTKYVIENHKTFIGCTSKGCRVLDRNIWEETP